jgi:hypothetical protein
MARYQSLLASLIVVCSIVTQARAAQPAEPISVGSWLVGAYNADTTGTFSHCAAGQGYGNGRVLTLGESATRLWLAGVVSAKLNALKFARATGAIPENINFALKTGTLRDFLDNSAVPYLTEPSRQDLKPADVASAARSYIFLVTCTAEAKEAAKK